MDDPQIAAVPPLDTARPKRRTAFDSARAKQAALLSAAARRAKADFKRNPPPIPPLPSLTDRILRLDANMRAIEQDMLTAKPSVKAALAQAHARLFDAWQVLTQTPNPGSVRRKNRPAMPTFPALDPEPDGPQPTPQPVVSSAASAGPSIDKAAQVAE